jgi:hypothetical protein
VDGDVHAGMCSFDLGEELGEQPPCGGTDGSEPGLAGHLVTSGRHVGGDVLEFVEHPSCSFDHHHALIGETASLAIDQDDPELLFETGDVTADVGLHRVQRSSSCRERSVVGDRHEGGELPEIHLEKRYQVSTIPT